jgi:hypothetical protein
MITYQTGKPENIIAEADFLQIKKLLRELAPNKKKSEKDIENALAGFKKQPMTHIVLARDDKKIVGMGLQIFIQNWFGLHSFLHDIVIEEKYRGKEYGIFARFSELFLENDKKTGSKFCDLTCGKGRVAAHKAYQKNGFIPRESTVFRRKA